MKANKDEFWEEVRNFDNKCTIVIGTIVGVVGVVVIWYLM